MTTIMRDLHLFTSLKLLTLGIFLTSFIAYDPPLKYMQVATIEMSNIEENSVTTSHYENHNGETISLQESTNNIPLYYFKRVVEEVCFDSECRILDVLVYWNITGRYLGFELPKGEFLSKLDHEPFFESEYKRLHDLLADSALPLDAVSFEKLLEQPQNKLELVDGVSGATSKSVASMVVKDAAYTTYKLWNIVNGPIMDFVSDLTEKELSSNLINLILKSTDSYDKLWALNRIKASTRITKDLETSLLEIVSGDDYYLAYKAINAIDTVHLVNMDFQDQLFSIYNDGNHSIQRTLIKKLMEADKLSSNIVDTSRALLTELNGQQLHDFLRLYEKHDVKDLETIKVVAGILNNTNRYVSKKAYDFLDYIQPDDETIRRRIKAYKNQ